MLTASLACHFPTKLLLREKRYCKCKSFFYGVIDGSTSEGMLHSRRIEVGFPAYEESGKFGSSFHLLPSFINEVFSTSKRAASLAVSFKSCEADVDESSTSGEVTTSTSEFPFEKKFVKSTRLYKRRKVDRRKHINPSSHKEEVVYRKFKPSSSRFLRKPNAAEENQLILDVQQLMKLEKLEVMLCSKLGRRPYLFEWAKAARVSCRELKSQLKRGYKSKERLIFTHFGLVVWVAHKFDRYMDPRDLYQVGYQGLLNAIERFEPKRGARYITYAYHWILGLINRHCNSHRGLIRLPAHINVQLGLIRRAKEFFMSEGISNPTKQDIAKRVGISVERLDIVRSYETFTISVSEYAELMAQNGITDPEPEDEEEYYDESSVKLEDIEDPEGEDLYTTFEKESIKEVVHKMLNTYLSPKQKRVLQLRYGFEISRMMKYEEIGNIFGQSRQNIHQMERNALKKLEQNFRREGLDADCISRFLR